MKITIYAKPVFEVTMSREQIDLVRECSRLHYDTTCRAAVQVGQFLHGWKNLVELSPPDVKKFTVSLTAHQLDLTCKILEMPINKFSEAAYEIRHALRLAWEDSQRQFHKLEFPVDLGK